MALHVVVALSFLSLFCVDAWRLDPPRPPIWPASYMAKGIINLPYAEIGEPFDAWYDASNKRSRIDYYSGKLALNILCHWRRVTCKGCLCNILTVIGHH